MDPIYTYCELHNVPEIKDLKEGMDFRIPEVRKEVFMRLYEFHTGYGIQPGLVYLYLPLMAEQSGWNMEQKLWAAFLEGICENPCTVWAITRFFPNLPTTDDELAQFEDWHAKNWRKLDYDRDTRYNKGHAVKQVRSYLKNLNGKSQESFFTEYLYDENPYKWFDNIWSAVNKFYKFGRLTSWSYIEFIKILTGWKFEYSSLMMNDLEGSKSHRNGCLKVMGRDDLEWWKDANNGITKHNLDICYYTEMYGMYLLSELKERFRNRPWADRIGYQTLESTLCTFKNCFHGERYPNVYTDMSYDRIKKAESIWGSEVDFHLFWLWRKQHLPKALLKEFNSDDPGLKPEKQNYFKETGHLPMLSVLDPVFKCSWDKKILNF